jgi:carboxymethylenebutenolidase
MNFEKQDGWLEVPPTGKGEPVLVLHAWWGLNEAIKAFCTRLAEAGFAAFAPDLYHGKIAEDIPGAEILSSALDSGQAKTEIIKTASALVERYGQGERKLSVIGFSLGAFLALDLSVTYPELVRSVVIFYGTRSGDYSSSKAAYLGHFAELDEYEPQPTVEALEAALRKAGRPVNFYRYPSTGHWFFEADRPGSFKREAADLAWKRTLNFLKCPEAIETK